MKNTRLQEILQEGLSDVRGMILNGRAVEDNSLEVEDVDPRDYPDFSDAFFSAGNYEDGTPLTDEELIQLGEEYPEELFNRAYESLHESNASMNELGKRVVRPTVKVGDRVTLSPEALGRHSRSVPAHVGYTTVQFQWRDTLRKLEGKVGVVKRVFDNSNHVNVDFDGTLIGIDSVDLVPES